MERMNGWDHADPEEARCIRKLEGMYFKRRITNIGLTCILILSLLFVCGVFIIMSVTWVVAWSVIAASGFGFYIYVCPYKRYREFLDHTIYCRKVTVVGRVITRGPCTADLMTEEGELLEGLTVPCYILSELEYKEMVYIAVTDSRLSYQCANLYPFKRLSYKRFGS